MPDHQEKSPFGLIFIIQFKELKFMINFTSILTAIKGASLTTKIGLGVGAIAIVASDTTITVTIINAAQPKEPEIVISSSDADNSPSGQKDSQTEETKTEDQKPESIDTNQKPTTSNPQTTTKTKQ